MILVSAACVGASLVAAIFSIAAGNGWLAAFNAGACALNVWIVAAGSA